MSDASRSRDTVHNERCRIDATLKKFNVSMMTMHYTRTTQIIFIIVLGQIPVLLTLMILILAILQVKVIVQ